MRPTQTGLLGIVASCTGCGWVCQTRNGLGLAAQHYDRTGHTVHIEITRVVIYGDESGSPNQGSYRELTAVYLKTE